MPLIKIQTCPAVAPEKTDALLQQLSKAVAAGIGKPEPYVMVCIESGPIRMAGEPGSAAFADVRSIGGLGAAVNARLSKAVCEILQRELGIEGDRVYLNFTDVPAFAWGWNGATFG